MRAGGRTLAARWPDARAALLPLVMLVGLGAASGGYEAPAWGWSSLALCWIAALALLLRREVHLRPLELALPAGLALFLVWTLASLTWTLSRTGTMLEVERQLVYPRCSSFGHARIGRWRRAWASRSRSSAATDC